jgi:hypothetical protein
MKAERARKSKNKSEMAQLLGNCIPAQMLH